MDNYFTCTLIDGTVLDFDKQCSQVADGFQDTVMFKQLIKPDRNVYLTLAIIPTREIKIILRRSKED